LPFEYILLALAEAKDNQADRALKRLRKLKETPTTNILQQRLVLEAAMTAFSKNELKSARDYLQKKPTPTNFVEQLNYVTVLFAQEPKILKDKLTSISPDNVAETLFNIAVAHDKLGQGKAAIQPLADYIKRSNRAELKKRAERLLTLKQRLYE